MFPVPFRLRPPRAGRRPIRHLVLAALILPALAGPGPLTSAAAGETAVPQRRVVVRFITDGDYPPFNYVDDDGVLSGFNVDLARALCGELQAACDIKMRPWADLLPALRRGEADAVIAGHAVTPKILVEAAVTDRYFYTPGRFAARLEMPKTDLTPETLDGVPVGVAQGTPHEAYLKTFFRDSRIQTFETPELAREALLQGKVGYVFDDGIGLAFWVNGTLSRRCCEMRGGAYLEPRFFGDGLAIAVPADDPEIRSLLNSALQKVRASGRFEELVSRYFPYRIF